MAGHVNGDANLFSQNLNYNYSRPNSFFLLSIAFFSASSQQITDLLKFWVAWEVLPRELNLVVVRGHRFPTASTCSETLKLPAHYTEYDAFAEDLQACIVTWQHGFGLV